MAILLVHALVLRTLFAVGNAWWNRRRATSAIWAVGLPYGWGPRERRCLRAVYRDAVFLLCSVVVAVMAHNASLVRATPGLGRPLDRGGFGARPAGVHARAISAACHLIWGAMTISGVGITCGAFIGLFTAPLRRSAGGAESVVLVGGAVGGSVATCSSAR